MYCPRCSVEFTSEIKYCRQCGFDLRGVSQLVEGSKRSDRLGQTLIRYGISFVVLGMIVALSSVLLAKAFGVPENYGMMAFLFLFIVGLTCMGGAFLFGDLSSLSSRRRRRLDGKMYFSLEGDAPVQELSPATTMPINDKVVSDREPVPVGSVTEHTTRQLSSES